MLVHILNNMCFFRAAHCRLQAGPRFAFGVAQRCQIHPSLEAQKYIFERKDLKLIRVTVPKESMDMNLLSATASSWLA